MATRGLSVPIPTLWADDGGFDPGRNAKFARSLCEAKVEHLFVLGSLGEFPSVEDTERPKLLEAVLESLSPSADAWVGVGAPTTRRAVRYAEEAESAGAAVAVAVPPYYLRPTEAEVLAYYRALHAALDIPLLAYNIPSLVGYPLSAELVHRLGAEGTIVGAKDTAGSMEHVVTYLEGAPPGFAVLPGDDAFASGAIEKGAAGAVMGVANVVPRLCVELVHAAEKGEWPRARELQALVDDVEGAIHAGPFPSAVKFLAAHLRKADVGYRAPYGPLTSGEERAATLAIEPLRSRLQPFL